MYTCENHIAIFKNRSKKPVLPKAKGDIKAIRLLLD